MRHLLTQAMCDPDQSVITMEYEDAKHQRTRRVISPVRFLPNNRLLAICLCREEPRQFHLDRCHNLQLKSAAEFVMPVPMG